MLWAPGTTFPSLPGSSPWGLRMELQPVDGAEMMSTIPGFLQDPFICSSPSAPSIDVTGSRWHSDSWNKTQSLSGCLEGITTKSHQTRWARNKCIPCEATEISGIPVTQPGPPDHTWSSDGPRGGEPGPRGSQKVVRSLWQQRLHDKAALLSSTCVSEGRVAASRQLEMWYEITSGKRLTLWL